MTENRFSKFKEAAPAQNRFSQFAGPTRENAAAAGLPPSIAEGQRAEGAAAVSGEKGKPSFLQGFYDRLLNGFTVGHAADVQALEAAVFGQDPATGKYFQYDRPFDERYNRGFGAAKAQREQYREEHPYIGGAAELGGTLATILATAGQGATLAPLATTVPRAMGVGATEGAFWGGLYGHGNAEPGERMEGATAGAVTGALSGGVLGGVFKGGGDWLTKRSANKALTASAPTMEAAKQKVDDLYAQAERTGIKLPSDITDDMATIMRDIAKKRDVILPTGRFDEGYPEVKAVVQYFDDYAKNGMTPNQLKSARSRISKALADSKAKGETAILSQMMDFLDSVAEKASPDLKAATQAARNVFAGEKVQVLNELAEDRAGGYTSSGLENAIRAEARTVSRQITRGKAKGWTPDEKAAIKALAKPGGVQEALREVGKYTPSSPWAATLGPGALGAAVGAATGVPMLGTAAGVAAGGIGMGARAAATSMQKAKMNRLLALALSGGKMPAGSIPAWVNSPQTQQMLARILAGEAGGAMASKLEQVQ